MIQNPTIISDEQPKSDETENSGEEKELISNDSESDIAPVESSGPNLMLIIIVAVVIIAIIVLIIVLVVVKKKTNN